MLQQALPSDAADLTSLAERVVAEIRTRGERVPGLGHPKHTPGDPRVQPVLRVAAANAFSGRYVDLMEKIADAASRTSGKALPLNATGAIGAIASELGMPWQSCRGIAVMARAIGLVAHLQEEMQTPLAPGIWSQTEERAQPRLRSDQEGS
jgi:citrate synthase